MSDRFHPLSMEQLVNWIYSEYEEADRILGLPSSLFFTPGPETTLTAPLYGQRLDTPFGVAAGPHTQLAPNIVLAWLSGARVIELKTVQELDNLEISKPCIAMPDEGYNIEWSQELSIDESVEEYVRAWVLIHALHRSLGHPGDRPALLFNMSVGYDLKGVQGAKVERFISAMLDAGSIIDRQISALARRRPELRDLEVPARISNSVTLSTMHGCPPDEIGRISSFLMQEWGLHTSVKLNPTMLGAETLRGILNENLGWQRITVPDAAFDHDIGFDEGVGLLRELGTEANTLGLDFGVKLTNTLEVQHTGSVFPSGEDSMYLSGRPLHALSVNLAHRLSEVFSGQLLMSFSGGADAFNIVDLLASGLRTVTSCSDLLRPGGYSRLLQYIENTGMAMKEQDASSIDQLIRLRSGLDAPVHECAAANLRRYAEQVRSAPGLQQEAFARQATKTRRQLGFFDCTEAPCTDACSVDQAVPRYLRAVRDGDLEAALAIVNEDNPLPAVLGRACTHPCELVCLRTHYDEALAIREIKRFIMDHEGQPTAQRVQRKRPAVAIIGGGPCGLGAATFLGRLGYPVTIFERRNYPGGMVEGTIPAYRTSHEVMGQDLARIRALGIDCRFGQEFGRDFSLDDLQRQGFEFTVVAAGAQEGWRLGIPGEEGPQVFDGLRFLRAAKHGTAPELGSRIAVIGGGDVAMDCARSALRLSRGSVSVLYRRTRAEMPAQPEEIRDLLTEGAELLELVTPVEILRSDGQLTAIVVRKMKLGEADASGRRRPVPVPGSEYEMTVDSLILAIGQRPRLEFLADCGIELTDSGHIRVDEHSLESSRDGVYAGGDAVSGSTLSIVRACGHGRRIAAAIHEQVTGESQPRAQAQAGDRHSLLEARAKRAWRVEIPHLDAHHRQGFDEVVLSLDPETARREAARCLDCDLMCSTCETVCPNHAIFTYEARESEVLLPILRVENGQINGGETVVFAVDQTFQIGILTDLCNECGNCATFCPTAGEPYRDKPRFFLHREDFRAESDNAFLLGSSADHWEITGRYEGQDYHLEVDEGLIYRSPEIEVTIAEDSLEVTASRLLMPRPEGDLIDLGPLAEMLIMLRSVRDSMPGFPVVHE